MIKVSKIAIFHFLRYLLRYQISRLQALWELLTKYFLNYLWYKTSQIKIIYLYTIYIYIYQSLNLKKN